MSMYEQFETDAQVEKDGIWLDYGDFQIRVARAGGSNKAFQKEVERLTRPYRRAIATESLPREKADEILAAAYAKAIVRAWQTKVDGEWVDGIENPEGGDLLEPSVENIRATFKLLPELYADVQEQATSWALFKASIRDDASGN